LNHQQQHCY